MGTQDTLTNAWKPLRSNFDPDRIAGAADRYIIGVPPRMNMNQLMPSLA